MIDNIKMTIIENQKLENYIEKSNIIDLESTYNYATGEIMDYPKKGKYKNLEIRFTNKSAYIKGSLHKCKNELFYNESHNHDDFNYCEVTDIIEQLINRFNIGKGTKLTNLEFGFNIETSINPQQIVNNHIIMFDMKSHNRNLKFRGNGDFKEYIKTDYSIKIYNKGKQYKQQKNILRVELKITKSRELEKLGIFCLEDLLKPEVITGMYWRMENLINKIIIIDDYNKIDLPPEQILKLKDFTNPNFWNKVRDKSDFKNTYKKKQEFISLIDQYKLNSLKNEITEKISIKFSELLETDCNTLQMVA